MTKVDEKVTFWTKNRSSFGEKSPCKPVVPGHFHSQEGSPLEKSLLDTFCHGLTRFRATFDDLSSGDPTGPSRRALLSLLATKSVDSSLLDPKFIISDLSEGHFWHFWRPNRSIRHFWTPKFVISGPSKKLPFGYFSPLLVTIYRAPFVDSGRSGDRFGSTFALSEQLLSF